MKLNDVLKTIRKGTRAETIDKSSFAAPTGYLDTGSYAINRVLTGDIHKGIPVGRITTLYGVSQSGKSLLAASIVVNALKNNQVDVVYIFDSEGGVLKKQFEKSGVDMSKINHVVVHSVEDCSVKMLQTYDTLLKARQEYLDDPDNNDDVKALCILDSFGALAADKLVNDAVNKDQMVQDMGLGPKLKNNLMRGLMMRVVESNATLIVINHEYQNPGAMFTSKIHQMGGGMGLEYASHVILQCEKLMVKASDTDILTGIEDTDDASKVGFYKGNKMKFFVVKNRIIKPCFQATVYIDFNFGISKYDGLLEDAVKYGFITEVHGGYVCSRYSDKKLSYKDLMSKDEIWNTFLDDFNKESAKQMEYSSATADELEKIEDDVNAGK